MTERMFTFWIGKLKIEISKKDDSLINEIERDPFELVKDMYADLKDEELACLIYGLDMELKRRRSERLEKIYEQRYKGA